MFDIHYHLLFSIDDGPKTIEQSLALAEASIREGVTHIVATPHANHRYPFDPVMNRERLDQLKEALDGRITVGLGCDFHLSYENLADLRSDPGKYTINGKQYLLVEFSDSAIPPVITETFYDMRVNGLVPIITHPERNPILAMKPERMSEWIRGGCLVQVTAASLTGRFGRKAQSVALRLIRDNWVHFIASDAHSQDGRPPSMREAYEILGDEFGKGVADRLCVENPKAAFFGEPLGPQPDPGSPYGKTQGWRKGFFSRLLGR